MFDNLYSVSMFLANIFIMLFVILSYQRLCGNKISLKKSFLATLLTILLYYLLFAWNEALFDGFFSTFNNELLSLIAYMSYINLSNYFVSVVAVYFILDKELKELYYFYQYHGVFLNLFFLCLITLAMLLLILAVFYMF